MAEFEGGLSVAYDVRKQYDRGGGAKVWFFRSDAIGEKHRFLIRLVCQPVHA
jgi:hypothetical protein